MKFKSLALGLAAALFAFVGCNTTKDDPSSKAASVEITSEDEVEIPQAGGSVTVKFISTRDWKIKNAPAWIVAEPEKGDASLSEQSVTFTALANDGMDRTVDVSVYAGTVSAEVTISQKGTTAALEKGDGTAAKPYTASQAYDIAKALENEATTPTAVYVRGIIHKLASKHTQDQIDQYGNGSFYISDTGQKEDKDFYCYQVYYIGGVKFTSADQVKVGDDVVIYGKLTNYNNTYETVGKGAAYIYTLNGNGAESKDMTIAEAIAAKTGLATVNGRIIATSNNGFIINDGTANNLFVPKPEMKDLKVNDIVKVTGALNVYGTCVRLGDANDHANIKVEASTATIPATPAQTPVAVAQTEFSAFDCGGSAKMVTVSGGVLTSSADATDPTIKYYNLDFGSGVKPAGSVYTGRDLTSYVGKKLVVTGYYCGKTSNWFMVMETSIETDGSKSFGVSPAKLSVEAAANSKASFNVTGEVAWTAAADNAAVTLSQTSGTGAAAIEVTVAENTTTAARTFKVTVSTTDAEVTTKSFDVTITQAAAVAPPAGDETVYELTNAEICAAVQTGTNSVVYSDAGTVLPSAGGNWTGSFGQCAKKTNDVFDQQFLQIRNNNASYMTSPVYDGIVTKIIAYPTQSKKTTNSNPRALYVMPVVDPATLPTGKDANKNNILYDATTIAGNYGYAEYNNQNPPETITVDIQTANVSQFSLLSYTGATYYDRIVVYVKK